MVPDPGEQKVKNSKAFLLTTEPSLCHVRLTLHMSHMAFEKPHGQAVSGVTCHAGAMCWKTFQAPSKA